MPVELYAPAVLPRGSLANGRCNAIYQRVFASLRITVAISRGRILNGVERAILG